MEIPNEAVMRNLPPWAKTRQVYERTGMTMVDTPEARVLEERWRVLRAELATCEREILALSGSVQHARSHAATVALAMRSRRPGMAQLRQRHKTLSAELRKLERRADDLRDHRAHVEQALVDGLPVPPYVLAEYPDLCLGRDLP